ncbi:MAG: hypothetical protein M1833_000924 [Piccolia ochrophora]|nr:MAG: hypothetical protein M1833_000924 [Piccolia ochrophora]
MVLFSDPDSHSPSDESRSENTLRHDSGHTNGVTRDASPPMEDAEKARDEENDSPKPVNFFHSSLKGTRRSVYLGWARTTLILSVFILSVLAIYWAVQFSVYKNMASLGVFVVDFDGQLPPYDTGEPPMIGPLVTMAAQKQMMLAEPPNAVSPSDPLPHLGWEVRPPSDFDNDPMQVRQAVYNYKAWAAIIINANASALVRQAIAQGNASYDPLGAAQTIYVQARDQTTIDTYIVPQLNAMQTEVTSMFGKQWAQMVLQNASDPAALANIQKVPQAVSPGIGFSVFNLRPFGPPVATPAVSIGLIYLIILSFFSFSFYLPIHMKFINPKGHPPLHFWQLILWRWISTEAAYLLLSLSYSLLSLAFQLPFSNSAAPSTEVANNANNYGRASFVVFWMLNWVGMTALGLACENVAMVIGFPWTAMWLIFWVITNVSTSFYEIATAPRFYYWGYAWPLHNIVEASRTIIFNTHSRIGLNFGILFAWCAVNSALFPLCCYIMRWKSQREERKQGEKEE